MRRMVLRIWYWGMFLFIATGSVKGQTISGFVFNDDKKPLAGAYVSIEFHNMTTSSDDNGKYRFVNVPQGELKITVTHVGYKKKTKVINVTASSSEKVNFILQTQSTELSEISVVGTAGSPNNTTEISGGYLDRIQAVDMKDIFMGEPSVSVGGGSANAQRIYLRGIEGSNLNITIDGAEQGRSLFQHRGNAGSIEPSLLKQVKVSTGAEATQSSGGLGGSISFETIDAQDLIKETAITGGKLSAGLSGVSDAYNTRAILGAKLSPYTGLLISASIDDQDDYRTKSGIIPNTAFKSQNYFAKFSLLDYKHHDLRLSSTYNRTTGYYITGGAGSDMGIPSDTLAAQYQVMSRNTYTLDYRFFPGFTWLKFRFNAYYNHRNLDNEDSGIDVTSNNIGGSIKNDFTLNLKNLKNTLTVGTDFEKEDGISNSATSLGGTEQTNTSSTWGLFAQAHSEISVLSLSYGIRWDDYKSDFGPHSLDGNRFSPNAGVSIDPLKGLRLFADYSEAVRAGGTIPIQWMANITGDTNFNDGKPFKPETSEMKQAGLNYREKNLFTSGDELSFGAKIFNTRMENLIERVGGGGGFVSKIWNDTLGVISKGYELSMGWKGKNVHILMGYVHVGIKDKDGNPIEVSRRKVAPTGDRFNGNVLWQVNPEIQLNYMLNAVRTLKGVYESDRPGYVLHGIQAHWSPQSLKGLMVYLAVYNLFNKEYSEQTSIESGGSIIPEPGRDIRVSLAYRF